MAKKYKRSLLALGPLRKSKTDKLYLIISIPMFFVKFNGYHGTYFYVMLVLCPSLEVIIQCIFIIFLYRNIHIVVYFNHEIKNTNDSMNRSDAC